MNAPGSSLEMPDGWAEHDAAWRALTRGNALFAPGGSRAGRHAEQTVAARRLAGGVRVGAKRWGAPRAYGPVAHRNALLACAQIAALDPTAASDAMAGDAYARLGAYLRPRIDADYPGDGLAQVRGRARHAARWLALVRQELAA